MIFLLNMGFPAFFPLSQSIDLCNLFFPFSTLYINPQKDRNVGHLKLMGTSIIELPSWKYFLASGIVFFWGGYYYYIHLYPINPYKSHYVPLIIYMCIYIYSKLFAYDPIITLKYPIFMVESPFPHEFTTTRCRRHHKPPR